MSCAQSDITDYFSVLAVPNHQIDRYRGLASQFKELFGTPPEFYGRAPGRVNLIGEHVDYCGYAVLPMALEQDIVAAVSVNNSGKLRLHNTDPSFRSYEGCVQDITIEKNKPEWDKYFLCGLKGILDHLQVSEGIGMNCLVDGRIPKSAGLSSSSALVCCAALTSMHANKWKIPKTVLADLCARSEKYIGTEGGGMDQAISFLAQAGTAKLIEFNPLEVTDVILPTGAAFLITNSCVEMNKAASALFNIRVIEGRLATQVIAKQRGLDWPKVKRPRDLQVLLGLKLEDMLPVVREVLHEGVYTKKEVLHILGVTADELALTSLSLNTLDVDAFHLRDRLNHVFSEANRVYEFKRICDERPVTALQNLGDLMNASHASCSLDYQCSCTELDELVDICRQSGALGSRLVGAGWGGCAVSLVMEQDVPDFMSKVVHRFYRYNELRVKNVNDKVFATSPGSGAVLYVD